MLEATTAHRRRRGGKPAKQNVECAWLRRVVPAPERRGFPSRIIFAAGSTRRTVVGTYASPRSRRPKSLHHSVPIAFLRVRVALLSRQARPFLRIQWSL